jgi:hypothetical protein
MTLSSGDALIFTSSPPPRLFLLVQRNGSLSNVLPEAEVHLKTGGTSPHGGDTFNDRTFVMVALP